MVTATMTAVLGSSRQLLSGPTTAISILVFSAVCNHAEVVTPEFVSLMLTLTFLTGGEGLVAENNRLVKQDGGLFLLALNHPFMNFRSGRAS